MVRDRAQDLVLITCMNVPGLVIKQYINDIRTDKNITLLIQNTVSVHLQERFSYIIKKKIIKIIWVHSKDVRIDSSVFSKLTSQREKLQAEVLHFQSSGPVCPLTHVSQSPSCGSAGSCCGLGQGPGWRTSPSESIYHLSPSLLCGHGIALGRTGWPGRCSKTWIFVQTPKGYKKNVSHFTCLFPAVAAEFILFSIIILRIQLQLLLLIA